VFREGFLLLGCVKKFAGILAEAAVVRCEFIAKNAKSGEIPSAAPNFTAC
jgi:hypothetical protein